jgi:hypothetical protein
VVARVVVVAATAAAQATGTLPSIHPRASTGPGGAVDAVTSILLASSAAPYVEALRSSLLLDRVVAAAALTPGSIAAAMARVLVVLGVLGVVCAPVLVAAAGHLLLRMVAEVVVVAEAAAVVAARVVVAEATVAAVTATVAVVTAAVAAAKAARIRGPRAAATAAAAAARVVVAAVSLVWAALSLVNRPLGLLRCTWLPKNTTHTIPRISRGCPSRSNGVRSFGRSPFASIHL